MSDYAERLKKWNPTRFTELLRGNPKAAYEYRFEILGTDIPRAYQNTQKAVEKPTETVKGKVEEVKTEKTSEKEESIEDIRAKYKEVFGKDVANVKKNDADWMKAKISETK